MGCDEFMIFKGDFIKNCINYIGRVLNKMGSRGFESAPVGNIQLDLDLDLDHRVLSPYRSKILS